VSDHIFHPKVLTTTTTAAATVQTQMPLSSRVRKLNFEAFHKMSKDISLFEQFANDSGVDGLRCAEMPLTLKKYQIPPLLFLFSSLLFSPPSLPFPRHLHPLQSTTLHHHLHSPTILNHPPVPSLSNQSPNTVCLAGSVSNQIGNCATWSWGIRFYRSQTSCNATSDSGAWTSPWCCTFSRGSCTARRLSACVGATRGARR